MRQATPSERPARARRGTWGAVLATVAMPIVLASATASAASGSVSDAEASMVRRIGEYEALLGQALAQQDALCLDGLLAHRWLATPLPSERQWQGLLAQARQALETCIATGALDRPRAAAAIRRAMALQVERQRALAALQARLRACLAQAQNGADCDALRREGVLTPEQERRLRLAGAKGSA